MSFESFSIDFNTQYLRTFNRSKQFLKLPQSNIVKDRIVQTERPNIVNVNNEEIVSQKFIESKNNTTSGGFPIGSLVNKDMRNNLYTNRFIPSNYQQQLFPDLADFKDENIVAGDKSEEDRLFASYWNDWGNDVFDRWGFFYLYNVETGKYYLPLIEPQNLNDGVLTNQTFNAFGRTFTITQGYPVQGIFKFDISVNDNKPFRFGAYGNMGFDSDGIVNNLSYPYNLSGENLTLYYNLKNENGDPIETLYSYFIPKNVSQNSAQTYNFYLTDDDDTSIMSKPITNGLLVYFAKTNDVKLWIINDLQLANP